MVSPAIVSSLHVGREQRDLLLGGLIVAEAEHALAGGDAKRSHGLAGDSELAPHTTNHLLGGHGGLDAGHDEPKSLDNVVRDRRWWAAPSEHPPDDDPQLPAVRAEAPIFSTARAERLEREETLDCAICDWSSSASPFTYMAGI
jgi:hypothetical protein